MGADKLNINVRYEVTLRRCAYAQTIKDADNPSEKITELLTQLITDTRARCIKEMEHDCVLTYTVVEDFSIVNYSKLRQMGLALAIVRKLNKEAKRFTPVGGVYYHTDVVGLHKITVSVKTKRKWWFF